MKRKQTVDAIATETSSSTTPVLTKKFRVSREPSSALNEQTQTSSKTQRPDHTAINGPTLSKTMSSEAGFWVCIQLSSGETPDYMIHNAHLASRSSWFRRELLKNKSKTQMCFFYLDQNLDGDFPLLYQKHPDATLSRAKSSLSTPSSTGVLNAPIDLTITAEQSSNSDTVMSENSSHLGLEQDVKLDSDSKSAAAKATLADLKVERYDAERKKNYDSYSQAYHHLFKMLQQIPPKLHPTDLSQVLSQCEKIVTLATFYGCLAIIRPYLGSILLQFHRELYIAISKDPPRWLNLSVALESAPVFSEALIHCAGRWGVSLCKWPTSTSILSPVVNKIVESKARRLASLRWEINMTLLVHGLQDDKQQPVTPEGSWDRWLIVSRYRDWLAQKIYTSRREGKWHLTDIYHCIFKGGEAYLPTEKTADELSLEVEEVQADLDALKKYASMAVARLVRNNLMVDVDAVGVEYFTCTEVNPADYPWLKS